MTISLKSLTGGELAGGGVYDELMRTTLAHVKSEHEAGRITDANYATVYLGAMNANLSVAAQFTLQYELTNQQLLIAAESLANTKKQGELLDVQIAQVLAQNGLLVDELDNLRPLQKVQTIAQTDLIGKQELQQVEQTKLVVLQQAGQEAQTNVTVKQEALVDEQISAEATKTVDATGGQALAMLNKTEAEVATINQKKLTEEAQTIGSVGNSDDTLDTGGLIGYEMKLKKAQGDSFLRDAEQKAAKFYSDVLSIVYSTNPDGADADPALWGLGPADSKAVMTKVLDGI